MRTPTPVPGQVGRLIVPEINLNSPIVDASWHVEQMNGVPVAVWDTDEQYVSHLLGSKRPGEDGNCVLAGHGGLTADAPLARLSELEIGTRILVQDAAGFETSYTIIKSTLVQQTGISLDEQFELAGVLDDTDDTRLTLVTCWPGWGYTHRLVVIAQREEA